MMNAPYTTVQNCLRNAAGLNSDTMEKARRKTVFSIRAAALSFARGASQVVARYGNRAFSRKNAGVCRTDIVRLPAFPGRWKRTEKQ